MSKHVVSTQNQGEQRKLLPVWQRISTGQMIVVGSALLVDGVANVALHFNSTSVVLGMLAVGAVARHSNDIIEWAVPGSNPDKVRQMTADAVEAVAPSASYVYADQSTGAKLKRLFGIGGKGTDLYLQVQDEEETTPVPSPVPQLEAAQPTTAREEKYKGQIIWGKSVKFNKPFNPRFNSVFGRGILLTGTQGAGKSNIIGLLMSSAARNKVPSFLVDYKNEFYTLKDVHETVILCGHPDFAGVAPAPYYSLTKENVAEFAALIMDHCWQGVFNVQSYRGNLDEMAEVLALLLHELVGWNLEQEQEEDRLPCLIITDEAHNMTPEDTSLSALALEAKNFKKLKRSYIEVANTGRSFGMTLIMATQRLANIAKWSVANLQIQIIMRQDLDRDIIRCKEYIGEQEIKVLPSLRPGQGFVKGLSKSPMLIEFDEQEARHVSKTPDLARIQKKQQRRQQLPPARVLARRIEGTNEYEYPHRDSNAGVPTNNTRDNLSVFHPRTGTPEGRPETRENEPVAQPGFDPNVFVPGPDDLLLSGLQINLLKAYYEDCHNVRKSLQQIRDEDGKGLGSRYTKHASFILEQCGLKKRGA